MIAIETTAVAEDESHLVRQQPLARKPVGAVKVILMLEEDSFGRRQLGHLEGRASCRIGVDFTLTDEKLLGS